MTKFLIWLVIIAAVVGIGWGGYTYWEKIENEKANSKKQQTGPVNPDQLPGMPWQLEGSLQTARSQGPDAFANWLKTYGRSLSDPRKAWIELDYCVMVAKRNPQEARRVFAQVKQRTPQTSLVYPRIKELARTYE